MPPRWRANLWAIRQRWRIWRARRQYDPAEVEKMRERIEEVRRLFGG
jgi:hypothetical protein